MKAITTFKLTQTTNNSARQSTLRLALWCLLSVVVSGFSGQRASAQAIKPGDTVAIHVSAASLAEVENPSATLLTPYGFQFPGPEQYLGYALRDLRDYLGKTTGAKLSLQAMDAAAPGGIFAGTTAEYSAFKPQSEKGRAALVSSDPEAFVIEAQGSKLYLIGKTDFGVIAAIYTLLDNIGVKWFAPGDKWENVPQPKALELAALNASSSGPSYKSRLMFSNYGVNSTPQEPGKREAEVVLWMLRNRMGGSAYVQNQHNEEIIPPALFETNPEYFAKTTKGPYLSQAKDGRLKRELARHKPEVVELAVKNAIKYFEENKGKGSTYDTYSLETGDGITPDEEGVEQFGNATDLNFWFANEVAKGLEKAGYKDKWVGILSYHDHADVPSFDLHPQVSPVLTNGLTPYTKLTTEERLDGFRARKANRLGVYDYFNVASWSLNWPGSSNAGNAPVVAANLKRWHEHGARVFQAESTDSWGDGGPGNYIMARMLWDVNGDPSKELDEYYQGAFGPVAPEVRALYEDWSRFATRYMPRYRRDEMAYWHSLISTADAKLKDQPVMRSRLNDLKRYYLYINAWREFHLEFKDPRMPSRDERFWKLVRYVASNRGQGAFHARGLVPTLFPMANGYKIPLDPQKMGPELTALSVNHNDEAALKALPVYDEAAIDRMFAAARLPLDNSVADKSTLDVRVRLLQTNAKGDAQLNFPKIYLPSGIGATAEYLIHVLAPTPKLTFEVRADRWNAGAAERLLYVHGPTGKVLKQVSVKADEPATFELSDVAPGLYTVMTADTGTLQISVRGGNIAGAMRGFHNTWGLNPMRPTTMPQDEEITLYFLVPAKQSTLNVRMTQGTVDIGFENGDTIATGINAAVDKPVHELTFAVANQPRVAYVTWKSNHQSSIGFVIDETAIFNLSPDAVLYESLN
jgi:hypothetical protein